MKWQKRLSVILCALLVASSCFFQAFSTNAWADTNNSTTQDYFCTLFAVPSTYDPAHHGSPINIPNATTTGAWKSTSVANCNRRWAAAADAVTNGRPAVVAAGQFNRSLSA